MKHTSKIIIYLVCCFTVVAALSNRASHLRAAIRQESIAKEVIRLHVLANSDDKEDQALKLKVKDAIVGYLQQELGETHSVAHARREILQREEELISLASQVIAREGYSYPVSMQLGQSYFPEKTYGDLTFPEGTYEALQIKIGAAKGKNWWCVLFPTLCFVDESTAVVPDSSKEILKETLTLEEYNSLLNNPDVTISYRLGIWEDIKKKLSH